MVVVSAMIDRAQWDKNNMRMYSLRRLTGGEIMGETCGFTDLDSGEWRYEDMLMAACAFTDGYVYIAERGVRNVLDGLHEKNKRMLWQHRRSDNVTVLPYLLK